MTPVLRRLTGWALLVASPLGAISTSSGCATMVAYGIGSAIDERHAFRLEAPACEELVFLEGVYVVGELYSGERIRGTLQGARCDRGIVVIDPGGSLGPTRSDTLEVSAIRLLQGNRGKVRGPLTVAGFATDFAAVLLIVRAISEYGSALR